MRKEAPLLSLPRVAFALHAVTVEVSEHESARAMPYAEAKEVVRTALTRDDFSLWSSLSAGQNAAPTPVTLQPERDRKTSCRYLNSFEIDILNYRGIQSKPVISVCHTGLRPVDVEIHVPKRTEFRSEGNEHQWRSTRTSIPARLALSYTRFPSSGVRVWHVVFRPRSTNPEAPDGGAFTELDLIKLITLYDGAQEESNVRHAIELSRPGLPAVPIDEFIFAETEGILVNATFSAGTVEIELSEAQADSSVDWAALFDAASRADPSELHDELEKYKASGPGRDRVIAASGIVQGIFDYDRLEPSELCDVFRPVIHSSKTEWRSINCATLLDVSVGADLLGVTKATLGISPYLIIPHAVALHNEFVAAAAEAQTDRIADVEDLVRLSRAADAAQRLLHRLIVPNVFLYASEHELLDRITEHRGAATLREVALRKLAELEGRLDRDKALSAARRSHWLAAFLSILSLGVLLDAVTFYKEHLDDSRSLSLGVTLVLIAVIVLGGLYAYARPRR